MQWIIPAYIYARSSTLAQLLEHFVSSNQNRVEGITRAIGVSKGVFQNWLDNTWTNGLTTKYKQAFENVTGISLDRLMVIQAKREILSDLEHPERIEEQHGAYARCLHKHPGLESRISFEQLKTRDEILDALIEPCKRLGTPLAGYLFSLEPGLLHQWVLARNQRPTGNELKRCLIGALMPSADGSADQVRIRLLAQGIFGCPLENVLGVGTLEGVIQLFFEGYEMDAFTIVASHTGVESHTVARLKAGTSGVTSQTMIKVLRSVFERKLKNKRHSQSAKYLEQFDRAAAQCKTNSFDVDCPLYGPNGPQDEDTTTPQTKSTAPEPSPTHTGAVSISVSVTAQPRLSEPAPKQTPPTPISPSTLGRAMALTLQQQLLLLQEMDPNALSFIDWSLIAHAPHVESTPSLGNGSLTNAQEEGVLKQFDQVIALVAEICRLPERERLRLLRRLDDPLGRLAIHLDAVSATEPQNFLASMQLRPMAVLLAGK